MSLSEFPNRIEKSILDQEYNSHILKVHLLLLIFIFLSTSAWVSTLFAYDFSIDLIDTITIFLCTQFHVYMTSLTKDIEGGCMAEPLKNSACVSRL